MNSKTPSYFFPSLETHLNVQRHAPELNSQYRVKQTDWTGLCSSRDSNSSTRKAESKAKSADD